MNMFDKIKIWYTDNYSEITWFIIGFLFMDFLIQFGQGNWAGALISAVVIAINYSFVRRQ